MKRSKMWMKCVAVFLVLFFICPLAVLAQDERDYIQLDLYWDFPRELNGSVSWTDENGRDYSNPVKHLPEEELIPEDFRNYTYAEYDDVRNNKNETIAVGVSVINDSGDVFRTDVTGVWEPYEDFIDMDATREDGRYRQKEIYYRDVQDLFEVVGDDGIPAYTSTTYSVQPHANILFYTPNEEKKIWEDSQTNGGWHIDHSSYEDLIIGGKKARRICNYHEVYRIVSDYSNFVEVQNSRDIYYYILLDEDVAGGISCVLIVTCGIYAGVSNTIDPSTFEREMEEFLEKKTAWFDGIIEDVANCPYYYYVYNTSIEPGEGRMDVTETVAAKPQEENTGNGTDGEYVGGGGEQNTGKIPWDVVGGILVVGAGTAGGIGVAKAAKKGSSKKQEEEPKSTLEIRLFKNFGDTLTAGAPPVDIGVRIVEVFFAGGEKERPDLTSRIQAFSPDGYLRVQATGMNGAYLNVRIEAPEDVPAIPPQAMVALRYVGEGGMYTNQIIFRIQGQKISFFQENLTLPAVYDRLVRLPFVAEGIPQDAQLGAEIDGDAYEFQGIENGERPDLYYVVFYEKTKTKDKAGKYETYDLTVTASVPSQSSQTGVRQVSGTIPVIRYHMGLAVYMPSYIGCYLEKFDPRRHGTHRDLIFKNQTDGTEYSPAVTDVSISMITWDEESHKIVRGRPKFEDSLFTIEPLDEADDAKTTDFMSRATWQKTDAEIIQMVGIYPECHKICNDGSYLFKLRPSGLIDAPARRKVNFKIKAVFRGETYEFEKKVWLFSQKPRDCGAAEMEELRKKDRQITRDLRYIVETINGHGLYERLGAIYRVAKMMLDGFEERFGYDENLYYVVKAYFNRVCRGISVGANAKPEDMPEYPPDKGFVCDVMQALHDTYDDHEKALESWAMILPRMGLAGLTFGVSEGVFSTMKVCHDMVDTVNNGGSEFDAFIAGVKEPLFNFVGEKLMQAGMNTYAKGSKGGFKDTMKAFRTELDDAVFGEAARQMGSISDGVEKAIKSLKNCAPEYHGNRTMESLNAMKSTEKTVAKEADDLIKDFRRKGGMSADATGLDETARKASLEGLDKVKKAERAYYEYSRYKTPEAEAEFKAAWLEVKKDLEAVRQLDMSDTPAMRNVKSEGFRLEENMHARINKETISRSVGEMKAKGRNISEDDIYVLNASGTSNEAKYRGDKVAHDRDTTFMEKGKVTKDNPGGLDSDVDADVIERNYALAAYREMYGVEAESLEAAKKAVADHHFVTVQGDSLEKVGANITEARKYYDPKHFGEKYADSSRVADSLEYKVNECFMKGEEELTLADAAVTEADREIHLMEAIRSFGEGERTFGGKVSDNVVLRCTANNTVSQITREERLIMQIFRQTEAAGHTGPTTLSTIEAIELAKSLGYQPTDTGRMIRDIVLRTEK